MNKEQYDSLDFYFLVAKIAGCLRLFHVFLTFTNYDWRRASADSWYQELCTPTFQIISLGVHTLGATQFKGDTYLRPSRLILSKYGISR